jgi:hypothetical protein
MAQSDGGSRNWDFLLPRDFHQQYLVKNPGGYCGLKGTEVSVRSVETRGFGAKLLTHGKSLYDT